MSLMYMKLPELPRFKGSNVIFYAFVPAGFFFTGIQYFITLILNIKEQDELYLGSERK